MAGRPPPSFKTDVNRQKTKKWTDAKSYSYEGDDWGGYDEFGEYGTYDPQPDPRPSNTGFRQPGQGPPPINTNVYSSNPATAPTYRPRINSFEAGDDRRNISAGAGPPPSMASGPPNVAQRAQSPRTVSQPISNIPYDQNPASFPPRQSSMSTTHPDERPIAAPIVQQQQQQQQPTSEDAFSAPQPMVTESGPSDPDSEPPAKPFPFIRPADIYKRIEEERLRERRSGDSSRTSLESTERARREDRSALASPSPGIRDSSGSPAAMSSSLQPVPERRSEYGLEGISVPYEEPQQDELQRGPDPVQEPEQVSAPSSVPAAIPEPSPAPVPIAAPEPEPEPEPAANIPQTDTTGESESNINIGQPYNSSMGSLATSFSLPQLSRISGFGNDFWSMPSNYSFDEPATSTMPSNSSTLPASGAAPASQGPSLQPQPSPGLRSVVEHAFDPNEATQSPATQSGQGSQRSAAGSELSGSNSTSGISPIMSRVPSAATAARKAQDRPDLATSSIIEENQENTSPQDLPESTSTLKDPVATGEGHSRSVSVESGSTTTITPSYHRDMMPPNTTSNAARSLTLETEPTVPQSSSAEFDRVSPSSNYTRTPASATTGAYYGSQTDMPLTTEPENVTEDSTASKYGPTFIPEPSSATASGRSSPARNRVKNLASQYDEMHNSRSNSINSNQGDRSRPFSPEAQAAAGNVLDGTSEGQEDPSSQLDVAGPRPQLPGSWVSYAESSNSATADQESNADDSQNLSKQRTPTQNQFQSERGVDLSPDASNQESTSNEPSSTAMAAVAAAGTALAASVASTVALKDGSSTHDDDYDSTADKYISSPAPLRQANPSPVNTSGQSFGTQPTNKPRSSWDNSDEELESDRLHQDIVRSLNRTGDGNSSALGATSQSRSPALAPPSPHNDDLRQSTAIPREYDSYWATGQFDRSLSDAEPQSTPTADAAAEMSSREAIQEQPNIAINSQQSPSDSAPPPSKLTKRFSWEEEEDEDDEFAPAPSSPVNESTHDPLRVAEPSFGDVSPITATEASDRGMSTSPVEERFEPSPLIQPTHSFPDSAEPTSAYSIPEIRFEDTTEDDKVNNNFTLSDPMAGQQAESPPPEAVSAARESDLARSSVESKGADSERAAYPPATENIQAAKLPPFREIMAMKQPTAPIQSYNQTRDDFATMQTGLGDWLTYMVTTFPEHAVTSSSSARPTGNAGGLASSVREKLSPSMAKAMSPSGSQPYYQQYLNSPGGALPPASSAPAAPSSSSPGQMDTGAKNRTSGGQMQTKGKDFLHSAGVLGGKASSGAKGLFAKGKSKLKTGSSDKGQSSSKSASRRAMQATKDIESDVPSPSAPTRSTEQPSASLMPTSPEESSTSPPKLTLPFQSIEKGLGISSPTEPEILGPRTGHPQPSTSPISPIAEVSAFQIYREDLNTAHTTTTTAAETHQLESPSSSHAPGVFAEQGISSRDFSMSTASGDRQDILDIGGYNAPSLPSDGNKTSFESFRTANDEPRTGSQLNLDATSSPRLNLLGQDSTAFNGSLLGAIEGALSPELRNLTGVDTLEHSQPSSVVDTNLSLKQDITATRDATVKKEADTGPMISRHAKTSSTGSLEIAAARLKEKGYDIGGLSPRSSVDSKDLKVAARDIHPAMREEFYHDTNNERSRSQSVSSSGRGPSVDLDKLPPSVRKQYEPSPLIQSSFPNASRDSQVFVSSPQAVPHRFHQPHGDSQDQLIKPPIIGDDPDSRDTSVQAKRRSMSPWKRFKARSRGNSVNDVDAYSRPSTAHAAPTEDQEEQGNLQQRNKSPWRRFRRRSRGFSLGDVDALAGSRPTENRLKEEADTSNSPKRPMPAWQRIRGRSRGTSIVLDSEPQNTTAPSPRQDPSTWQKPTARSSAAGMDDQQDQGESTHFPQDLSAWQKIKARSRSASMDIGHGNGKTADVKMKEGQDMSARQRLRARSRGASVDVERDQEKTTDPPREQDMSPWQNLRARRRFFSMDQEQSAIDPNSNALIDQSSSKESNVREVQGVTANREDQYAQSAAAAALAMNHPRRFDSMPAPRQSQPRNTGNPHRNLPHLQLQTNLGNQRHVMLNTAPAVHTPPLSHYAEPQHYNGYSTHEGRQQRLQQRPQRTSDMVIVPVAPPEASPDKPEKKRRTWFGGILRGSSPGASETETTRRPRKLSKPDPKAESKATENPLDTTEASKSSLTPREQEAGQKSTIIRIPINPPLSDQPHPDPGLLSQIGSEQPTQDHPTGLQNRLSHKEYLQSHGVLPARPALGQDPELPEQTRADMPRGRRRTSLRHEKSLRKGPPDPQTTVDTKTTFQTAPHNSTQRNTLRRTSGAARAAALAASRASQTQESLESNSSQPVQNITPVPQPPQFQYNGPDVTYPQPQSQEQMQSPPGTSKSASPRARGGSRSGRSSRTSTYSRRTPKVPPPFVPPPLVAQEAHGPLSFAWEDDAPTSNRAGRS